MSYLLKYIKETGTKVEAIRATGTDAIAEAQFQRSNGAKALVCYKISKTGSVDEFFRLVNYKICYKDKDGGRHIINGYRWSYIHDNLYQNIIDNMKKSGFPYVKIYVTPLTSAFDRVERLARMRQTKTAFDKSKPIESLKEVTDSGT